MSSDHSTYQPTSGFGKWIDSRLPLPRLVHDSFVSYPVPRNLNYAYTFGGILMVMLVVQLLTGIVLAMHYAADTAIAFQSVEKIMRDVNSGWLLRYMHANGASFFFVAVYLHIARGMYYGSYKAPREVLWILGVVILLLMMATAFMGYVLPWGQMSFWGATVITGFFTAFPGIGEPIQQLLLGGFAVDNPTLNRFFSLHYLLPFMITGVVILHVWALHVTGQTNPTGVEVKTKTDTVPFTPYATVKDALAMCIFLMVFAYFIFFMPNFLGHADNYIPATRSFAPSPSTLGRSTRSLAACWPCSAPSRCCSCCLGSILRRFVRRSTVHGTSCFSGFSWPTRFSSAGLAPSRRKAPTQPWLRSRRCITSGSSSSSCRCWG